jgi:hypothetical protein
MTKDLTEIRQKLTEILKGHLPPLRIENDSEENFVVHGNKETMQGKKKVDGIYFASVVPKAKDVRLYYFPAYTHPEDFARSEQLQKFLKGKSCFHIKWLDDTLEQEIRDMVASGVKAFQADGWV